MPSPLETVVSVAGARAGGVGMMLVMAPRWFRGLLEDFIKLSDKELRLLGYVLIGTAASIFAQRVTTRVLSAKIDALKSEKALTPA